MTLLAVDKVAVYYGDVRALHDVSVAVKEGEIVAVIGANGAGKTTLLNAISGMIRIRCGDVLLKGSSLRALRPDQIVGLGISHVPERRQVFGGLSVADNVRLGAYCRFRRDQRAEIEQDMRDLLRLFPALAERGRRSASTLSGGEQQMLAIARGLMAKPALLLLDEPSLGLAPMLVSSVMDIIVSLRERGATILLVEQNAHAALSIADRAYLLERGSVVLTGSAAELLSDERVRDAYLGKGYRGLDADRHGLSPEKERLLTDLIGPERSTWPRASSAALPVSRRSES